MTAPSSTGRGGGGRARVLGVLAGRLTARDRWLLRMLHEHTVLTTTHLHRLGWAPSLRQVQGRARVLRAHEVVDGFRPLRPYGHGSHPLHLVLGPVGAQVLAAEAGLTVAEVGYRGRARALSVAHRLTLAHDIATTDLVCGLAAAPGLALVRWWSARRCVRYFGHHARPDAYLTLTTTSTGGAVGWWEMFLEFDTGSENLTQLTGKLAGYHALAAETGVVTPLGIWFTRPGREPSARRALTEALHALPVPSRVPILTGSSIPTGVPPRAATTAATSTASAGVVSTRATLARAGASGAGPGWSATMSDASAAAGGRAWLALRPGVVERVDLSSLARLHPRPTPAMPDRAESESAGPDSNSSQEDAHPAGEFPAPHPYPPGSGNPGVPGAGS
jgi:hypothetical protein